MIKLISKNNPNVLAFQVINELEQEDVDWLIKRIKTRKERRDTPVLLYIHFKDFGELSLDRVWSHFKMLVEHVITLVQKVDKIAVISSNKSLKEKLSMEFSLIPTVTLKNFDEVAQDAALDWLLSGLQTNGELA